MMPSPYTSQESLEDAAEAAKLMGVQLDDVGIQPAMSAFEGMLEPIFGDAAADVTEENIQARPRPDPDGDFEQARLYAADHRQQVRDVGRLRDALWRYVRRLFGPERRL